MPKFTNTESKSTPSLTKEAKPRTGNVQGGFGTAKFGTAKFGIDTGRDWSKESKSVENLTKEAKP